MSKFLRSVISLIVALSCTLFSACMDTGEEGSSEKESASESFTFTIFSDVHHADRDYNNFNCTKGMDKLKALIDRTTESEFYVNLGDMVDYLKNGSTLMYDRIAQTLAEKKLNVYNENGEGYTSGNRMIYNVMGNHEAAYITKQSLSQYIPYRQGIGCVYTFEVKGVLFVVIDANFSRYTYTDTPNVLMNTTDFMIPQGQIDWIEEEIAEKYHNRIKSIAWISHVAYKDIDENSRWNLVEVLSSYGLPITVFEGHTHIENKQEIFGDGVDLTIYTLPPVTNDFTIEDASVRDNNYSYYDVTVSDGIIEKVDRKINLSLE